ncbi:MAG TPA: DUF2256 domain-containing protein [Thioalkalivibrio sp.]|nr:DUF2256 domain-containing protein [Thioalkalivibrio sp.]
MRAAGCDQEQGGDWGDGRFRRNRHGMLSDYRQDDADPTVCHPEHQVARATRGEPSMPRMRKKSDLPEKICVTCGRPFSWRRKWRVDWASVRYCSERCRRLGPQRVAPGDGD